ncbi:hypothetical protein Tco_0707963 [Tanacetum coccineum]
MYQIDFGFSSNNDKILNESLLDLKKVEGYMVRWEVKDLWLQFLVEEDERELLEMEEVGVVQFGGGEGGIAVAGVDRDRYAEKEETGRI